MEHQRYAHRFPGTAGGFRMGGAGRRRQLAAHHVRKADAGAFEHIAFFQHAGRAAAAFRTLPAIVQEMFAIDHLDGFDDAVLQVLQVFENGLCVHAGFLKNWLKAG